MAWSRSRFTRYGRRTFGAYRRRNMRGRVRGNKRAANGQRDTSTVVINVQKTFQVPVPANSTSNAIAISIWQQLAASNMFTAYRDMYDQIKINGITARIRGLNGSTALSMANTPTICTAWDRNGLEPQTPDGAATPIVTYNDVTSYSSAIINNWSTGNAFRITRHIYPSTISEKSYYAACAALRSNEVNRNPGADFIQHTGVDFKPILLIGAYLGFQGATLQSIGFMIEFDITCTFRGLRRYSTVPDTSATQISFMAGSYIQGNTGQQATSSAVNNWKKQNNNANVEDNTGANENTSPYNPDNEIPAGPIIKTESYP